MRDYSLLQLHRPARQRRPAMPMLASTAAGTTSLVVGRDDPVEQPDAPTRGPALVDLVAVRVHGRAGNIQVCPGGCAILDETLQELRRRDGTAHTAPDVLHIGVLAVDELVVRGSQRHAPDVLAGHLAGI